jgi:hypothetical protein
VQLHRPAGVQLENIGPGHQQLDLIYFATPYGSTDSVFHSCCAGVQ